MGGKIEKKRETRLYVGEIFTCQTVVTHKVSPQFAFLKCLSEMCFLPVTWQNTLYSKMTLKLTSSECSSY